MNDGQQSGQGAAPLTRESAQAILESLRAACSGGTEHDPAPGPCPVRVGRTREGVVVAWRGLHAEGREEREALAVLVRREVASARRLAASRLDEARRLRDAVKAAPSLDASAVRINAELARVAPSIPPETTLDGFNEDDPCDAWPAPRSPSPTHIPETP